MINSSFQLVRTNPLLTSNFKVVVNSSYNLYLESFNANSDLNNVKYKHFAMQKNEFIENRIMSFYNKLPIELSFDVKYDNDNLIIQNDFQNQFDTTYFSGAAYIEDQWHEEEFEYLAPLYIRKNSLPRGFVILRVDDPSGYNLSINGNYELNQLNKDNFKSDVLNSWKCVKFFDMSPRTSLGEWIYTNYTNNSRFPKSPFEYDPDTSNFSVWNGIDYNYGVYTRKPMFIEDKNSVETPHFRFEKFITEGYKKNGLIFPNILNFKFLFDDTPATPNSLRKYSMNRYYGFYIDKMEHVGTITSYITPPLRTGMKLVDNVFVYDEDLINNINNCILDDYDSYVINSGGDMYSGTTSPFIDDWNESYNYYIFIDNTHVINRDKTISGLYEVKRIFKKYDSSGNSLYFYKIISDETMDDYWNNYLSIYPEKVNVKNTNITYYKNYNVLVPFFSGVTSGHTDFFIDKYINCSDVEKYMYGDLYLIEINGKYHVIKQFVDGDPEISISGIFPDPYTCKYYIQTDYAINLNEEYIEYWIAGKNTQYYKKYSVNAKNRSPLAFPIYRIKFSEIKDFDFDRIDTGYADFDYEKIDYVDTMEEKLYSSDYNYSNIPTPKKMGKSGTSYQNKISNISSEYIADDELYELYKVGSQNVSGNLYDVNEIWRKNQSICKWGFMDSISHSDYPYKLNNNYEVGGVYNRTVDPFLINPDELSKNMDYFYRIGNFYNSSYSGSQNVYYKNQSTNIQSDFVASGSTFGFEISPYFDLTNFDYFTYFFKNKMRVQYSAIDYEDALLDPEISTITKKYSKYSVFINGDEYVPSTALFKGLKFKIRDVKNMYVDNNKISSVLLGNKDYNDYKFSIIFNQNNGEYSSNSGITDDYNYIDTLSDGIHIILNDTHKNLLIIINAKTNNSSFNNTNLYSEKDAIYYGKDKYGITEYNPNLFTAANFIHSINDYNGDYGLKVKYYYIKESTNHVSLFGDVSMDNGFKNSTMTNIENWKYNFPPFLISVEYPTKINLKNNCYVSTPFYIDSVKDDYAATIINYDTTNSYGVEIYRYNGPYEPIFKDVDIFEDGYFCHVNRVSTTGYTTGYTESVFTRTSKVDYGTLDWINFSNVYSINVVSGTINSSSEYLCFDGFDFSTIPSGSIIDSVKLSIERKVDYTNDFLVVGDRSIEIYISGTTKTFTNSTGWTGSEDFQNIAYDSGNATGITQTEFLDIANIQVRASLYCTNTTSKDYIMPQIKSVKLAINYRWVETTYASGNTYYFGNNYKFDTSLDSFGIIKELIHSKVNEDENFIENLNSNFRMCPSVDEHGYTQSDRFIFKSPWDKEFFIETTKFYDV